MIIEIDKTLDEIKDIRQSFYSCTFEDADGCRDCMYKNYDFPDCQYSSASKQSTKHAPNLKNRLKKKSKKKKNRQKILLFSPKSEIS